MQPFLSKANSCSRRSRARSGAVALLLALAVIPGVASAARVVGKVAGFRDLRNPVWEEARDPDKHGYSFREPVPTVRAEFRKLYPHIPKEVCVAALAATAQPKWKPVLVRVGGGRTTPVTIVVPPGTQLTFENTDPFSHRLYAVNVNSFLPNETKSGSKREWTVPTAGSFEIRDELAPSLRMWVIGEPRVAAIAYPSMVGDFALTVEQPGSFEVQPYFAGKPVGTALKAELTDKDLDLSKAPIKLAEPKKGGE
jgi:plastocyanin